MAEDSQISRRKLLTSAALAAPAMALGGVPTAMRRKRVLRIAHLADIHVQPERQAALGFESCLEHAQSQRDKPNMILTGGDMVMDALNADKDRVKAQWDIFKRVLNSNTSLPVEHCVGNHDVWGWGAREKYGSEPTFGKRSVIEQLRLPNTYRSFDRAGWHFIILDSTHEIKGNGYTAKLGRAQFEWLRDDLSHVPTNRPIMVVSHIPILSASAFFDGTNERLDRWSVPAAWMHIDARLIKDLFYKYPNIQLCVSGHIHLRDQVVYNGINYFCNGAVCGAWWAGDYQECKSGYAMIDLYDDGSFTNEYISYGWKPRPEPM
jgi:3',5'-cyclic-AMP phosphodiesterase